MTNSTTAMTTNAAMLAVTNLRIFTSLAAGHGSHDQQRLDPPRDRVGQGGVRLSERKTRLSEEKTGSASHNGCDIKPPRGGPPQDALREP